MADLKGISITIHGYMTNTGGAKVKARALSNSQNPTVGAVNVNSGVRAVGFPPPHPESPRLITLEPLRTVG